MTNERATAAKIAEPNAGTIFKYFRRRRMLMSQTKKEVAVLLGRALEFFEFVKTLDRPKVYRSRLRAETEDSIYRGFCNPEMTQGINPNSFVGYGTYRQRFTPEDISYLELAVQATSTARAAWVYTHPDLGRIEFYPCRIVSDAVRS